MACCRVEGGERSTVIRKEEHILALTADVSDSTSCSVMLYMSQREKIARQVVEEFEEMLPSRSQCGATRDNSEIEKTQQRPHDLDFHRH